jgi:hypothetical protein
MCLGCLAIVDTSYCRLGANMIFLIMWHFIIGPPIHIALIVGLAIVGDMLPHCAPGRRVT